MTAAERMRRYRLAQRGVEPPEEPVNLQEERSDVRTEEERWQWSLELAAGDAIALRAFWTREFGPTWQEFRPSAQSLTLARQAAAAWAALVRDLQDGRMADYTHTIDRWDEATGENLIERIAGVSDYQVAVETYRAAVKRWPGAKITLRNRAPVLEQSWRD